MIKKYCSDNREIRIKKKDILISCIHPYEGKVLNLLVDLNITGKDIIENLRELDFIPKDINQYYFVCKEKGSTIREDKTLFDYNIKDGDRLRIIPATEAGGYLLKEIDVFFVHPSSGKNLHVTLDINITGAEIIDNLIEANFIEKTYILTIKGGKIIDTNETLIEAGVKLLDIIKLIPLTDAG